MENEYLGPRPSGGEPPARVAGATPGGDCPSGYPPCCLEVSYELLLFPLQSCTDPGIQTRQQKLAATTAAVRESVKTSVQNHASSALPEGLHDGTGKDGEMREALSNAPSISASQIPPPQVTSAALAVSLPIYGGAVEPSSRSGGSGGKPSEKQSAAFCLVKPLPPPSSFSSRCENPWLPGSGALHDDKGKRCDQSLPAVRYLLPASAPESGDAEGDRQQEGRVENSCERAGAIEERGSSGVARGSSFLGRKQKSVLRLKNQVISGVHCRLSWCIDTYRLVGLTEAVLAACACESGDNQPPLPLSPAFASEFADTAANKSPHQSASSQPSAAGWGGAPRDAWGHFLVFDADDSDLFSADAFAPQTADSGKGNSPACASRSASSPWSSSALPRAAVLSPETDQRAAAFWRPQLTSLLTRTNLACALSSHEEGRKSSGDGYAAAGAPSVSTRNQELGSFSAGLENVGPFPFLELQVEDASTNGTWIGGVKLQKQQGPAVWPGKATLALSKQYTPSEQPVAAFRWALAIKWRRIQTSAAPLSPSSSSPSSSSSLALSRPVGRNLPVEPMGGGTESPTFSLSSRTDKNGESPPPYPPLCSSSFSEHKVCSAEALRSNESASFEGKEHPGTAAAEVHRMRRQASSEGPSVDGMDQPKASTYIQEYGSAPSTRAVAPSGSPPACSNSTSTGNTEFPSQRVQARRPERERASQGNGVKGVSFSASQVGGQERRGTGDRPAAHAGAAHPPPAATPSLLAASAELLDLQIPSEDPPRSSLVSLASSPPAVLAASSASSSAAATSLGAHAPASSSSGVPWPQPAALCRARAGEREADEREKKKMRLSSADETGEARDKIPSTPCEGWSVEPGGVSASRESGREREKSGGRLAQQLQKVLKEKRELEDELQQLLVENEELRNTEQQRQEENATLQTSLQEAREKWKAAGATVRNLETQATQRHLELEALKATAREQEERLKCREREWREEVTRLRATAAKLVEEKDSLQEVLEEHKRALERYTSICTAVREQLRELSPRRSGPFPKQPCCAPDSSSLAAPPASSPQLSDSLSSASPSALFPSASDEAAKPGHPSNGARDARTLPTTAPWKGQENEEEGLPAWRPGEANADNNPRLTGDGNERFVDRPEDGALQSQGQASLEDLLVDPPGPLTLLSPSRERTLDASSVCFGSSEKPRANLVSARPARGHPASGSLPRDTWREPRNTPPDFSAECSTNGEGGLRRHADLAGRNPEKEGQSRPEEASERGEGSEEARLIRAAAKKATLSAF
ncbi:conserved hypothetical protein [Neospora caninum Liverpool]|uniref:Uncharacterized protein n=1 Tax=Neospora caninum (strain Liverpool) TaxID=572307 RepID=F0V9B9_NEOCL|nr:conserved hypothetical protein [Neospora caninum Liverpool]CBZ50344.1 conserved hypothetical protein [Neospora caninum Liverpool]|eukprot:XP_003880378.1 conserved hypothetical protein [Neospora caninum Liverpool]